jgi:hypothetical protein
MQHDIALLRKVGKIACQLYGEARVLKRVHTRSLDILHENCTAGIVLR